MHKAFVLFGILLVITACTEGVIYSGECTVTSYGLSFSCDVELDTAPAQVDIVYWRDDGEGPVILHRYEQTKIKQTVEVFRFVPNHKYSFVIGQNVTWHQSVSTSLDISTQASYVQFSLQSGLTGVSEYDNSPLVTLTGTPSFEVIISDRDVNYFAYDTTGWAVWYLNTGGILPPQAAQAKGQFSDTHNFVVLNNGSVWEFTPNATMHKVYDFACDAHSNSYYNHECRAYRDSTTYSAQQNLEYVKPGWSNSNGNVIGQNIVRWDAATNTAVKLSDSFQLWNVSHDYTQNSKQSFGVYCIMDGSNAPHVNGYDWTHVNSISEGVYDNILVSSRSLSSVVSMSWNGTDVYWKISSETTSDFTFPTATDKFYNQHDVTQLSNGNLLVFDNGADRPSSEGGVYSRAAEYYLNYNTKTASLVWEFVPPADKGVVISCYHGGSVTFLNNTDTSVTRIVSVPCDNQLVSQAYQCSILVYQVDSAGNLISEMNVSAGSATGGPNLGVGGYRAEPFRTINGETVLFRTVSHV